jgi:thiamine biosynthesis lipoprotein
MAGIAQGLQRLEHIMGMPIIVDVRDDVDPAALDAAFDWFRWVDATFSTYKPESEISRMARGELSPAAAHPEVRRILERSEDLKYETEGYFDIDAGGSLDPSGLVKGWSVDRAAGILERAGAENYAVYAGGDIRVHGRPDDGEYWRVGIQHPLLRDKVAAVVLGNNLAIATSGEYERGQHIYDPHTGGPPAGLLSVTVTGTDLGTADAYATAAFAMGEGAISWVTRIYGYEAMIITADGQVLSTNRFPKED